MLLIIFLHLTCQHKVQGEATLPLRCAGRWRYTNSCSALGPLPPALSVTKQLTKQPLPAMGSNPGNLLNTEPDSEASPSLPLLQHALHMLFHSDRYRVVQVRHFTSCVPALHLSGFRMLHCMDPVEVPTTTWSCRGCAAPKAQELTPPFLDAPSTVHGRSACIYTYFDYVLTCGFRLVCCFGRPSGRLVTLKAHSKVPPRNPLPPSSMLRHLDSAISWLHSLRTS